MWQTNSVIKKLLIWPIALAFGYAGTTAFGQLAPPTPTPTPICASQTNEVGSWCANVDCWTSAFGAPAQGKQENQTIKCCWDANGTVISVTTSGCSADASTTLHGTGYPYGCCSRVTDPPDCPAANKDNCPAEPAQTQ
jgi:hypothetical protein